MEEKIEIKPEQVEKIKTTLRRAYDGGENDATFLFNSMGELYKGPKKTVNKIFEKYYTVI